MEKVYVDYVNYNKETKDFGAVRIPEPYAVVVLVNNKDHFHEVMGGTCELVKQGLRDEVMASYDVDKTFPINATPPYKREGIALFSFDHLERDEYGEVLYVYYNFDSTAS